MQPALTTLPVIAGRRSRCLAFTRVVLRETKAVAIRPTRPRSRRIIAVMRAAGDRADGARAGGF
jgi:hypothetical protein